MVRSTDHPDMTIAIYRGRMDVKQQHNIIKSVKELDKIIDRAISQALKYLRTLTLFNIDDYFLDHLCRKLVFDLVINKPFKHQHFGSLNSRKTK